MPNLMVDVITSLEGFCASEGWPGLWGLGGPEYVAWIDQDAAGAYTSLMGATTYRLFAGFADSGEEDMGGLTAIPGGRTSPWRQSTTAPSTAGCR